MDTPQLLSMVPIFLGGEVQVFNFVTVVLTKQ